MVKYLQELGNYKNDLTDEQMKEMEGLKKELEKYQEIELVENTNKALELNIQNEITPYVNIKRAVK